MSRESQLKAALDKANTPEDVRKALRETIPLKPSTTEQPTTLDDLILDIETKKTKAR